MSNLELKWWVNQLVDQQGYKQQRQINLNLFFLFFVLFFVIHVFGLLVSFCTVLSLLGQNDTFKMPPWALWIKMGLCFYCTLWHLTNEQKINNEKVLNLTLTVASMCLCKKSIKRWHICVYIIYKSITKDLNWWHMCVFCSHRCHGCVPHRPGEDAHAEPALHWLLCRRTDVQEQLRLCKESAPLRGLLRILQG